ncbi:hypothetical protein T4D_3539 [Trichinella pseudospiralis]|uniref:Uncharacterized protein n=1 Tax=Trichinella pseudospiralis TaxID=6337 RepID=A0A0V1DR77_TRIPS|nr:hypothetical protein T4D_3539 [Trichinella pseudospiralis]
MKQGVDHFLVIRTEGLGIVVQEDASAEFVFVK